MSTSANAARLTAEIDQTKAKLDETLTGLDRGPVKDALRLVIPMMHDQLDIIREVIKEIPNI